jgi:hypothetical protein
MNLVAYTGHIALPGCFGLGLQIRRRKTRHAGEILVGKLCRISTYDIKKLQNVIKMGVMEMAESHVQRENFSTSEVEPLGSAL